MRPFATDTALWVLSRVRPNAYPRVLHSKVLIEVAMAELLYTIECDALPADAHVVAFTGREALSEPYTFEIGVQTGDEDFDGASAVRAKAKLVFH